MSDSQAGRILVTFEAIGQAAADCRSVNQQLLGELEALRRYLQPMIATWTGRASEDYQALQARWDASANDLSEILEEIARGLDTAQENYQQTEQANASIWAV